MPDQEPKRGFHPSLPYTHDRLATFKVDMQLDADLITKLEEGTVWVVRLSERDIRERVQVVVFQRVDGVKP